MKSVISIFVMVLFFTASCILADEVKNTISEKEFLKLLSGTWINKDYDGSTESHDYYRGKYVIKRDGTYDGYANSSDTSRLTFSEIISIDEIWIDSEGNIWYKATTKNLVSNMQYYELGKIHSSGKVWELISLSYEYPNELDPNHGRYRIYYRQE